MTPTLLQSWLKNHAEYEASGRKLAIVMGPGGNAGALSAGITCAFAQTGSFLPNAHYIGCSVGAYSLLYTLIGQGPIASTIFGRYFTDNRYFNPGRLFTRSPSLNLDYVVDHVLENEIPLNYAAAFTSPFKLSALTTCTQGLPSLVPLTQTKKHHIQAALKATAAMPLVGRTHGLEDLAGWDGWLTEHHLLASLQQQNITDVIWFLNRPLVEPLSLPIRLLWHHIINRSQRTNPAFANLIRQRLAAGDFLTQAPQGMQLEVMPPLLPLSSTTRNVPHIFHALGTAYRHMGTYLGHPNLPYPQEWQPWAHHMPR